MLKQKAIFYLKRLFNTYRVKRFDKEPIDLGRSPANLLKDTSLSRSINGIR
jgi:hypothetical protein